MSKATFSDATREEIRECVSNSLEMHYREVIRSIILDGVNGLRYMTDQELLDEYSAYVAIDDELLARAEAELAIDKVLTE